MRCDLQIFSGCVCHLEQLHAQSPFLFPIVFSINFESQLVKANTRTARLSRQRGPKDIPPRPFSFVCVLPLLLWPLIPLLANLSIFFLSKSKSSSSRSSVLSACRSIFTKQNVPVVTCDGPAHYNVCTYFGMPIKLFLIRIWPRPPPPFSSGIRM